MRKFLYINSYLYMSIVLTLFLLMLLSKKNINANEMTWIPDTCSEARYLVNFDDKVFPDLILKSVLSDCKAYKELKPEDQFAAVYKEMKNKNEVESIILKDYPAAVETIIDAEMNASQRVKNFKFSYDNDRNLTVSATGLTAGNVLSIKTANPDKFVKPVIIPKP